MQGTSGPNGSGSSQPTDLQFSLANKLRQRLDGIGCPMYELTWKHWDMKSGVPICALRARVPRTQGSASSSAAGWPTPTCRDYKDIMNPKATIRSDGKHRFDLVVRVTTLAGWATPIVNDGTGSTHCYGKNKTVCLKTPGQAKLAGHPGSSGDPLDPSSRSESSGVTFYRSAGDGACDWLLCRSVSGVPAWRPVRRGSLPLVNGRTRDLGRFRAYGNAIVPQVASIFIQAFLEAQEPT